MRSAWLVAAFPLSLAVQSNRHHNICRKVCLVHQVREALGEPSGQRLDPLELEHHNGPNQLALIGGVASYAFECIGTAKAPETTWPHIFGSGGGPNVPQVWRPSTDVVHGRSKRCCQRRAANVADWRR